MPATRPSATTVDPLSRIAVMVLLGLVLSFGFLGSRGIWDTDEGRYTNIALNMLESGNWVDPMRNDDVGHWTKPPMTYWMIAGSISLLGQNPWAARLPMALSYLACMLLAGLIARHLAPGAERTAPIVYATMLLPFIAGHYVSTDFLLSAAQALALYGFVSYRFSGTDKPQYGLLLMWTGFALGFMTKGPPALLPLLAIAILRVLAPRPKACKWQWHMAGLGLFLLLALPWYITVVIRHDGLLSYFLGAEVIERVATDRFDRHGEWYGWLKIYLPTLLVGTLPWTHSAWRWLRSLPANFSVTLRNRERREAAAPALFLALWVLVPLAVFCIARSRLPLYILPLFLPIAIAIAATRRAEGLGFPRVHWLLLWVVMLLGLRLAGAHVPYEKDASAWASEIRARSNGAVTEVIFVEDWARYGLHLHLGAEIRRVAREIPDLAGFNPPYDQTLAEAISAPGLEDGRIYVTKESRWAAIKDAIGSYGLRARSLGSPYHGRIIFDVVPGGAN